MHPLPRSLMTRAALAGLLALAPFAASAHGNVECKAHPKEEWRPHTELQKKLLDDGWRSIRQIKLHNGCYEVYGMDPNGKRIEAFFDTKTFERVEEE